MDGNNVCAITHDMKVLDFSKEMKIDLNAGYKKSPGFLRPGRCLH